VALERLTYEAPARPVRGATDADTPATVRYRSDKTEGPTAGTETVDPLEFLARVTAHIPDKHQVMTRYYGWYANRPRGHRRRAGPMRIVAFITARAVIDRIPAILRLPPEPW
jgi:hypothetical protein